MRIARVRHWLALPAVLLLPVVALAQQTGGTAGNAAATTSPAVAATAAGPGALSLADALARALEEIPDMRTARAQVQQAEAESRSAWSNALPQLNTQLASVEVAALAYRWNYLQSPTAERDGSAG